MKKDRDYLRLYQVVRDRSRIQDVALQLLHLMDEHRNIRAANRQANNPYDIQVGVAFSLWRAVFLAEATDDWEGVLDNAETLLEKMIRDNAISYTDDWNNRKWSFLYYLNNARYRLKEFSEAVPAFGTELEKFGELQKIEQSGFGAHPFHAWEAHCNALWEAVNLLKEKADR